MISSSLCCSYRQNVETFTEFYSLQGEYTSALARHPDVIRIWLDGRPKPVRSSEDENGICASQSWRSTRMTNRRRRELTELLGSAEERGRLSTWLRASLPVLSLIEIGDWARPSLRSLDPAGGDIAAELAALREKIFLANYGLAKSAAAHGRPEGFDDRLSAACVGLLDAIDRYVPGERAARFAYFATYWIRYQIGRQAQKFGGVVSFPIYQQRMVRKIAQLALDRQSRGLAEATQAEICSALEVGPDAYYRHRQRPMVLSLHAPAIEGETKTGFEHVLCDPAPAPGEELEDQDLASRIDGWLKRSLPPATRVMLAYAHELGPLPEAAAEYLDHLREIARERLRFVAT